MKKSTDELLNILKRTPDVSIYLEKQQENLISLELPQALEQLLNDKSISKSDCIRCSGLDRTYCYQIFSGMKKPSRDKLLAMCFGIGLTAEEVQTLLKQTGYVPLYAKNERDSVILFAFYHSLSLTDVNELLFDLDLALLQ